MSLENFKASESLTIGVELELQLVNRYDFDLTPVAVDMLHLLNRKKFPGDVKPEMTESMIEVASDIQVDYMGLLTQLKEMREALVVAGDRLNYAVCGGGTHPFQHWLHRRISEQPRFKHLSDLYGYLAKQFTVFGQHIHIGCTSADQALFLLHSLNRYVPHFIALSASSPFFQGADTLFDSARLNSVFAFPLSGRAPFLLSWQAFEESYFAKMQSTGIIESMKDFYWDVRPKPEYGTIELRVCDTPLTVDRAAALACYLQALCRKILVDEDDAPSEDDYLVYTYNRFQACRFGLEGILVHPKTHETIPIRQDILSTLHRLESHAAALNSQLAMNELRNVTERDGNHAHHLRRIYAKSGSTLSVVEESVAMFKQS